MIEILTRLYKINKGKYSQPSYFATIKKDTVNYLCLKRFDGLLLKSGNKIFPTTVSILNNKKNFTYGFTIPIQIAKELSLGENKFVLISKAINKRNVDEKEGFLNLEAIIPDRTIRGNRIYLFAHGKDNLLIRIYARGNKFIIIPKFIPLEKFYSLCEFSGVYFCEGFKARKENKHRDRFSFSNASKEQIEWFINAVECLFGIKKKEWSVQILHPALNMAEVHRIIKYWLAIGIDKKRVSVVNNSKTNDETGVCILNIYNSTLAEIMFFINEECEKLALTKKRFAASFFRGFSRGDLGISRSTKNRMISFTTNSEENALFFKKVCSLLGIPTSRIFFYNKNNKKGYYDVYIFGRKIFKRIYELDLIRHAKRKEGLLIKLGYSTSSTS